MELQDMQTGEVKDTTRKGVVDDVDEMYKDEAIRAMGRDPEARHGGGQSENGPAPKGASPEGYLSIPGNQT